VRYFQNTLLLLGASALGAIACGPGLVYFLAATMLRPRRPEDWGAAFLVIPLLGCGSALGAILGGAAAIRWITTQDDGLWKPRVWLGASLGVATGLALHFSGALPGYSALGGVFQFWPVAAALTAALGTLGGIGASFAGAMWGRRVSSKPPRPKRHG
jgi:hypothetical protein